MTPDNVWVIGITYQPTIREYYLVFYHDIHAIVDKFIQNNNYVKYVQYSDFGEIKQIGVGGYGTVYTAKYNGKSEKHINMPNTVVLKHFKSSDKLFVNEVCNLLYFD